MVWNAHNKEQIFVCMKTGPGGGKIKVFLFGVKCAAAGTMGRGLMLKVPVAARAELSASLLAEYDGFEKKRIQLRNNRRGKADAED